MNRKRKPHQRKRSNKRVNRKNKGASKHQLDVRVKRRASAAASAGRRLFRVPLVGKIAILFVCLVIVVIGCTSVLGRFLWNNPSFDLASVEYESNGWLTEPQALETAEVQLGTNILRLDLDDIRDRLVALPQVKDATVVRTLPHKGAEGEEVGAQLGISIEERHPIAWLSCPEQEIYPKVKNNGFLLDEEGVALPCREMRDVYVHLPVVIAKGLGKVKPGQELGSHHVISSLHFITYSKDVLYDHALEIVEIKQDKDYLLVARYNNGMKVKFDAEDARIRGASDCFLQVKRLHDIFETFAQKGEHIKTVDLLPDIKIPVTFFDRPIAREELPAGTQVSRREPLGSPIEVPAGTRTVRRAIRTAPGRERGVSEQIDPDVGSILNPR